MFLVHSKNVALTCWHLIHKEGVFVDNKNGNAWKFCLLLPPISVLSTNFLLAPSQKPFHPLSGKLAKLKLSGAFWLAERSLVPASTVPLRSGQVLTTVSRGSFYLSNFSAHWTLNLNLIRQKILFIGERTPVLCDSPLPAPVMEHFSPVLIPSATQKVDWGQDLEFIYWR